MVVDSYISYVNTIPEVFKVVVNESATNPLSRYNPDPILTTAYLLDILNSTSSNSDLDYKRTRRTSDTLITVGEDKLPTELYKGYLLFKGTDYDIKYALKQFKITAEVKENSESGRIDRLYIKYLINNEEPEFQINQLPAVKLGQVLSDNPNLDDELCKVTLHIYFNVDTYNFAELINAWKALQKLVFNRLPVCTKLDKIVYHFDLNELEDTERLELLTRTDLRYEEDETYARRLDRSKLGTFKIGPSLIEDPNAISKIESILDKCYATVLSGKLNSGQRIYPSTHEEIEVNI